MAVETPVEEIDVDDVVQAMVNSAKDVLFQTALFPILLSYPLFLPSFIIVFSFLTFLFCFPGRNG